MTPQVDILSCLPNFIGHMGDVEGLCFCIIYLTVDDRICQILAYEMGTIFKIERCKEVDRHRIVKLCRKLLLYGTKVYYWFS